ncbi:hypothetical protein, partial [Neorhizobium galegae]|uniref:hypothetical protein n=1 Tax=Neorhizobium galegae TaxID=399 RepID=UPI0021081328
VHHQANVASNDKQIIQCLIESAALPFFFRMAGETFDGGVLDNLPIDALRIDSKLETEFGEIVAVGFRQSSYAEPVTSPYRLGLRLLESSINARTAYSKALLGEDRVVELPITFDQVTLSTFDLNSFFAVCKSTSIQSQIEVGVSNWFKAYSEKRANPEKITVVADSAINEAHDHAKIVASQSAKLRQLASIYHGRSNVRFATTLLEVTANSLKSVNPGEDRFDYQDDFYIGDEPVFSHVTRLFASNSGHVSQNQLLVYDDQGEEIPSVTFSVPDDVGDPNGILALFGKPIMPTAERREYTLLSKQHSGNSMRPIVKKGHDYLAIPLSQAASADCAAIRLFVPEDI